jgi:hypothetical protein
MSDFNVRYWMNQKDVTNKSRKAFQGEKSWKVPEPEDEVLEYVRGLCNNGVKDSHELLHFKAYEIIAMQGMGPSLFKVSVEGQSLRRWTSLSQHMPKYFDDQITMLHRFVTEPRKNSYFYHKSNSCHVCILICQQTWQLMGAGKKHNYSHNWRVALHSDAPCNFRWKKVAAVWHLTLTSQGIKIVKRCSWLEFKCPTEMDTDLLVISGG